MIAFGQFLWRDTGEGFEWTPPPHCIGGFDFRSLPQCTHQGEPSQGAAVFEVPEDPGPGYLVVADTYTDLVSQADCDTLAVLLGQPGLQSQPLVDLLWELVTERSDPSQQTFSGPVMPNRPGFRRLVIGTLDDERPIAVGGRGWPQVQDAYQRIYRAILEDVLAGRTPVGANQRVLPHFMATMQTDDHTLFIPSDLPVVPPLPAPLTTTIWDDFNRTAANPISNAPAGWAWTQLGGSGSWQISFNLCSPASAGNDHVLRAESDLGGVNMYALSTVATGSGGFFGVAVRMNSASEDGYVGFAGFTGSNDCRICKMTGGSRGGDISTGAGAVFAAGDTIKLDITGSVLTLYKNGTAVRTVTDPTFSGNLRSGMWQVIAGVKMNYFEAADTGGSSSITATLTQQLGDLTCNASAGTAITGVLVQMLGTLLCASTASAVATGTLTQQLGDLTCAANATVGAAAAGTLYAKAAGGNWSSASTWSSVNSAGSDNSGPPTNTNNCVFEAGSGNVTLDTTCACQGVDCTSGSGAYTGILTHNSGAVWNIGGSTPGAGNIALKFSSGMTFSIVDITLANVNFVSTSGTQQHITTAGKSIGSTLFNGSGGSWILDDALTARGITISAGTWNTNGVTVTANNFQADTGTTTNLGATTFNLDRASGGIFWAVSGAATLNAGTSNITLPIAMSASRTFQGGGKTYYDLTYTLSGSPGALVITGSNTFHAINVSDASNARTVQFQSSTTTTITSAFNVNGTAGNLVSVLSSTAGTPATLTTSAGRVVTCQYLSLKDSTATVGTFYAGATSTNVSGNTGWLFTDPPSTWTLNQTLGALTGHLSALTLPYGVMVAGDGAAAYWPLNERAGATTAHDYTGTRDGAVQGGIRTGRRGYWGRAMEFYGEGLLGTPGHIDLGTGPPALATAFSMDMWGYRRTQSSVSRAMVVKGKLVLGVDEDPGDAPGMFAFYDLAIARLGIETGPGANNGFGARPVSIVDWHHFAFTFTPGVGTKLYLDGVLDTTLSGVPFTTDDGSLVMYLGDYPYGPGGGFGWDGGMQAVAWYPSALSGAKILAHYQLGVALANAGTVRHPLSVLELAGDDDIMLRYNIATPITPSDSTNLARTTDAIYIGVGGDVAALLQDGTTRTFVDLAAGSILPMIIKRVNATNTTADSLLALYTQ